VQEYFFPLNARYPITPLSQLSCDDYNRFCTKNFLDYLESYDLKRGKVYIDATTGHSVSANKQIHKKQSRFTYQYTGTCVMDFSFCVIFRRSKDVFFTRSKHLNIMLGMPFLQ